MCKGQCCVYNILLEIKIMCTSIYKEYMQMIIKQPLAFYDHCWLFDEDYLQRYISSFATSQ